MSRDIFPHTPTENYTGIMRADTSGSLGNYIEGAMSQRGLSRASREMVAKTILTGLHEQGRAFLANTALQNTFALSALEAKYNEMTVGCENRYRAIIDSYVYYAAGEIARF